MPTKIDEVCFEIAICFKCLLEVGPLLSSPSPLEIEASCFPPAVWPYVSVICVCVYSVGGGTHTHAQTRGNLNIEGDQEHQHV